MLFSFGELSLAQPRMSLRTPTSVTGMVVLIGKLRLTRITANKPNHGTKEIRAVFLRVVIVVSIDFGIEDGKSNSVCTCC